jgi:hypothetical protein
VKFDLGYLAAAYAVTYAILIAYDLWLDLRLRKKK